MVGLGNVVRDGVRRASAVSHGVADGPRAPAHTDTKSQTRTACIAHVIGKRERNAAAVTAPASTRRPRSAPVRLIAGPSSEAPRRFGLSLNRVSAGTEPRSARIQGVGR